MLSPQAHAELAVTFDAIDASTKSSQYERAAELARSAVTSLRALTASHPKVAGLGLEIVADLHRARETGPKMVAGDAEALGLYRESVLCRRPHLAEYDVAMAALKVVMCAHAVGDARMVDEALEWAATCDEFPGEVAREAKEIRPALPSCFSWLFERIARIPILDAVAALTRLAEGETLAWAHRMRALASALHGIGENHLVARYDATLESALEVVDRELGPTCVEANELVLSRFYGAAGFPPKDPDALARRFLGALEAPVPTPKELSSALYVAERLASAVAEEHPAEALAIAARWAGRGDEASLKTGELHHIAGALQRDAGDHQAALVSFERALERLDPEHFMTPFREFDYKLDLAEQGHRAGKPLVALEAEIAKQRADWVEAWRGSLRKNAKARGVVDLFAPYLGPGALGDLTFTVPYDVLAAAGAVLGPRFLKSRVNERPSHKALLDACKPHAAATEFIGSVYRLEVTSLVTIDTPEIRLAVEGADEISPQPGGRIHVWWD